MKKQLLSLIAFASMFAVAGCGSTSDSGSNQPSENTPNTESAPNTESTPNTDTSKPSDSVLASDSSSDTSDTSGDSTSEEPKPTVPDMVETTVDALATTAPADAKTMYKVSGVWQHTGNDNDTYGNGFLLDTTSGNSLTIYGMSPDNTAFTYTEADGFVFKNPKKFQDIISTFDTGDKITLGVVYSANFKNFYSYFISKDADKSTFNYNVEIGTFEHGSITADKMTGTCGEKVTLTVTPDTDYGVDFIKLNDTALIANEGIYSFEILPGRNVITAGFVSTTAPITGMTISMDNSGFGAGYPGQETETSIVDGRSTITFKYINFLNSTTNKGLQSKLNAYLYNTTAFAGDIESVQINAASTWKSTTSAVSVSFGTAAITDKPSTFAGEVKNTGATISCSTEGAKYMRIDHTAKGMVVISSIVITFKA